MLVEMKKCNSFWYVLFPMSDNKIKFIILLLLHLLARYGARN